MKRQAEWKPSKYVYCRGRLRASRDPQQVGLGSRLITDAIAGQYERHLKDHCRGRLIDLGCGKVPLYEAYKNYIDECVCVDWPGTLHASEHLDQQCDLTEPLPFQEGEFDTIILSDVLEHIPTPERLWAEMARILADGGKCVLNVPFYYWLHETPHDYYRYTEFALRRFAELSGFRVVVLDSLGGAPEVVADVLAKNLRGVPWFGKVMTRSIQALANGFVATRWGRRVSQRTGRKFPLGYFMVAERIRVAG